MKLRRIAATASAASLAVLATAAGSADMAGSATFVDPGQMKWGDAPPVLPKGAQLTVLQGDPSKSGPFVIRLKVPSNYKIAPHWHSKDENLTVVSGTFYLAEGEKADTQHAHAIKAGAFHYLPAQTRHYAYAKGGPAVVQVHGEGPFDITYVNPADDPSKSAAK
jgi:quercetin dioxygenase-like cupin family protein